MSVADVVRRGEGDWECDECGLTRHRRRDRVVDAHPDYISRAIRIERGFVAVLLATGLEGVAVDYPEP